MSDLSPEKKIITEKKISRKELLEKIKENKIDILIGTHAIIQDIIPKTNAKLPSSLKNWLWSLLTNSTGSEWSKERISPPEKIHSSFVSMTATPIPRTLSLTIYGDLDLSVIDELPKGRKKIITKIIQPKDKKATYDFIKSK